MPASHHALHLMLGFQKLSNPFVVKKPLCGCLSGPIEQNFWVNAMRALSLGPVAIHSRDEKALSFLNDIRYQWAAVGGEERGFTETCKCYE